MAGGAALDQLETDQHVHCQRNSMNPGMAWLKD